MQNQSGYLRKQIWLHWIAMAVIIFQFVGNEPISDAWEIVEEGGTVGFSPLIFAHVAGGVIILLLALWRIALRRSRPPVHETGLMALAARLTHSALCLLMLALPVSGGVAWFGGIESAAEAHEVLKGVLMALVALHVLAALYHQFWLRDGLIDRMRHPID